MSDYTIKVGQKGGVVFGGKGLGQRFPVTLYKESWEFLLSKKEEILQFIEDNKDGLKAKEEKDAGDSVS